MMTNFEELKERGFIAQTTNSGIEKAINEGKLTFYLGLDPTADSLHVGHILPMMLVAHLQKMGHRPIILLGGGTALIGDPSGKSKERPFLSPEQVRKNVAGIKKQVARLFSATGDNEVIIVDNTDWLSNYRLVDFLRDIGKYFSINELIKKESIRVRLTEREQGISYTEFSYTLLQGADYLELFEKYNCRLQIGGADQWGNIISGVDLIGAKLGETVHALVCPLLLASTGKKFGKSEAGAIWLDEKRTSPYEMYQYWLNTPDEDVIRLLKLFTFLPLSEIAKLEKEVKNNPGAREAQKVLACQFTQMVHGQKELSGIVGACQFLFGSDKDTVNQQEMDCLLSVAPQQKITRPMVAGDGLSIEEAIILSGLSGSKSGARRLIDQGGIYLNNQRVGAETKITTKDFISGKVALLRAGKKNYSLLLLKK
jgi:tyrosyl-tRNA synthetase